MKQVGVSYRLLGVFVEKGKWKKLMRHPIYVIAMYCLRLRVAVGYLRSGMPLRMKQSLSDPLRRPYIKNDGPFSFCDNNEVFL
jgi:hypothetical protein